MEPLNVYACYNRDKKIRLSSSSGAVFSFLAEYVFKQRGVVYGVSMTDDCYSAEFTRVVDNKGLAKLRGSKYLQAKVGNTYKQVREDLRVGKLVLFSGTGCQVNGLKGFLGREYDNLICTDVICHGVPSPALWEKYARHQEKLYGGKLKNINFRCKDVSWSDFAMKENLDNIPSEKEKRVYISKEQDPYMQMFLKDYCLRPSCYHCIAKSVKLSDLTIADFWGINDVAPEMNDGQGTSLIIVRTKKGKGIFESVGDNLIMKEVSYKEGVRSNPAEYISCHRPPQRDIFFEDMYNMSFEELKKKYAVLIKVTVAGKIKKKIKRIVKSILRRMGGSIRRSMNNMDDSLCFIFDFQETDDEEKTCVI